MVRAIIVVFIRDTRAWSDQTHLAPNDVEYLRQLVQSQGSQQKSARDEPWIAGGIQFLHRDVGVHQAVQIILVNPGVRFHAHGSEFENSESAATKSYPLLPEQDRTRGNRFDQD